MAIDGGCVLRYRDLLLYAAEFDSGSLKNEADAAGISKDEAMEPAAVATNERIETLIWPRGFQDRNAPEILQRPTSGGITINAFADTYDYCHGDEDEDDEDEDEYLDYEPEAFIVVFAVETADAGVVTLAVSYVKWGNLSAVDRIERDATIEDVRRILQDRCSGELPEEIIKLVGSEKLAKKVLKVVVAEEMPRQKLLKRIDNLLGSEDVSRAVATLRDRSELSRRAIHHLAAYDD